MPERTNFTIRHFEKSDKPAVISLLKERYPEEEQNHEGFINDVIDGLDVVIAESQGLISGAITMEGPIGQRGAINYFAVNEDIKETGLEVKLFSHAEEILKCKGALEIVVSAGGGNTRHTDFFRKQGFKNVDADGKMRKKID